VNNHKHDRKRRIQATFSILVTSDSRDETSDESGRVARDLLTKGNHKVVSYKIVKNNAKSIRDIVQCLLKDDDLDVIITSGGTGISSRDMTVDTLTPLFEKNLNGFGELFRNLSYRNIGEAAMISRATAGIIGKKIVFCIPGSTKAMELALTHLILPGIGHILWEVNR
jgi:molybdenum cofactor biosynthesis protein B